MYNAKRAASGTNGTAQNQNHFASGKNKNFDFSNFRRNPDSMQCKNENCQSDYMRFQRDGFCQDCQQRVEFIYREKLSPIQRQQFSRKPILQGAGI